MTKLVLSGAPVTPKCVVRNSRRRLIKPASLQGFGSGQNVLRGMLGQALALPKGQWGTALTLPTELRGHPVQDLGCQRARRAESMGFWHPLLWASYQAVFSVPAIYGELESVTIKNGQEAARSVATPTATPRAERRTLTGSTHAATTMQARIEE